MNFEHQATIPAAKGTVWSFLMDVPRVSKCVPGVQEVEVLDAQTYKGTLKIRVGPISLALSGNIVLESEDEAAGKAVMAAQAKDAKVGGGVTAKLEMQVQEQAPGEVLLTISTTANVLGKLGEFGQPVIKKKTEQLMTEFTENVKRQLAAA